MGFPLRTYGGFNATVSEILTSFISSSDNQRMKRHPETTRISTIPHPTTTTPSPSEHTRQVCGLALDTHWHTTH